MLWVSNVSGQNAVLRKDLSLTSQGFVLSIQWSKTIQRGTWTHQVLLPFMGHVLFLVTSILKFMTSAPARCATVFISKPVGFFDLFNPRKIAIPTQISIWGMLWCRNLVTSYPQEGSDNLASHAQCPASHKNIGDAVFQYLLPDCEARFTVMSVAAAISKWTRQSRWIQKFMLSIFRNFDNAVLQYIVKFNDGITAFLLDYSVLWQETNRWWSFILCKVLGYLV